MKRLTLFTTGYSGHDPESFLGLLRSHGIAVVIDVRRNPISRKKGFSKTALSSFLAQHGVEYVHVAQLGVPKSLRDKLRDRECGLPEYLSSFREYLSDYSPVLSDVYNLATQKRCCLLCVEECSSDCHRSVVADEVASRNGRSVEVVHV